jgi:NADPH:quinone reductase
MRALTIPRFGGPDVLTMTELASPSAGPGELSIDVAFAGLNYAEVLYRRGLVDVPLPFVPGIEVAGHVRALGEGVVGFDVGQKVAALTIINGGGYAQVAVADAQLTAPLDDQLAVAACLPSNSTTAILAMERVAGLQAGEAVLVHAAAGGVGSQLGQAARLLGAGRVVGTVGNSSKLQAARAFGYDDVIVRETLADRVRELTAGRGFDVIADPVGGATRHVSVDALALGGRLVVMGNASGAEDVLTRRIRCGLPARVCLASTSLPSVPSDLSRSALPCGVRSRPSRKVACAYTSRTSCHSLERQSFTGSWRTGGPLARSLSR